MKSKLDKRSVSALLNLKKKNMLISNPEYQRGEVWKSSMQKRLLDSVLRGYPIPLIYLHYIKREVEGMVQEGFEVIDGQQRINALYQYIEGQVHLFHPVDDEAEARFPSFIKDTPCPWGGKKFEELNKEYQLQLLNTELSLVLVETNTPNEARDLFIRLQGGLPLTAQEKRDAWPGDFTDFVLKTGGKPELIQYPGHDFFTDVMGAKGSKRGEMRQLCAQLMMLYMSHVNTGTLCDIDGDEIDTFYYKHLEFDGNSPHAKRFVQVLDLLTKLLADGKRKKVIGYEAMHLVLLVDTLFDEYTRSWIDRFGAAFDVFKYALAKDRLTKDDPMPGEYWQQFGLYTRFNANRASTIQRRHDFFVPKMYAMLKPELKDPTRIFGSIEREIIYYRDKKRCQVCNAEVTWDEHEIHHVQGHGKGGKTIIENGVLVHKTPCHPKGKDAEEFAKKYWARTAPSPVATNDGNGSTA